MLPLVQRFTIEKPFKKVSWANNIHPASKLTKNRRYRPEAFLVPHDGQSILFRINRCYYATEVDSIKPLPSLESILEETEPLLRQLVDELYVKGLAVGFIADGQVAYRSLGQFQSGITPISEEVSKRLTFEIGSISKPLTGMALEALVQAGKMRYSSTIKECLPDVKDNAAVSSITMEELATHRSGLPRLPGDLLSRSSESNPYSKYSKSDVIASLNKIDDLKRSNEGYAYSNFGYGVLGLACASMHESKQYDRMMKDLIFGPLSMDQTSTTARLDTIGHNDGLEAVPAWSFDGLQGCGAIRSTPEDMIKLAKVLADPGTSKLEKVIINSTQVFQEKPRPMGLGWVLGLSKDTSEESKDVFWHNGSTGGYHSFIGVHKPSKRSIVILSNTANDMVSTTGAHLLSTLIGNPSKPQFHPYFAEEIPEELLQEYDGLYRYKGGMNFYVKSRGQELWVKLPKFPWTRAFPENPFKFHIRSLHATIEFDGIKWESGLPPHTLTYTLGDTVCHATRDGQEARKFLEKISFYFKSFFGGPPQPPM